MNSGLPQISLAGERVNFLWGYINCAALLNGGEFAYVNYMET